MGNDNGIIGWLRRFLCRLGLHLGVGFTIGGHARCYDCEANFYNGVDARIIIISDRRRPANMSEGETQDYLWKRKYSERREGVL